MRIVIWVCVEVGDSTVKVEDRVEVDVSVSSETCVRVVVEETCVNVVESVEMEVSVTSET